MMRIRVARLLRLGPSVAAPKNVVRGHVWRLEGGVMEVPGFGYVLSLGAAAALFTACGILPASSSKGQDDTQLPIGAGVLPQSSAIARADFQVLHRFAGGSDGSNPDASLIEVKGTLYGTTVNGGVSNCPGGCGTVYRITTAGAEKVLYRFKPGSDGSQPAAGLINVKGALHGTTSSGGTS
jgi:uncharacterized repeat protein (TIGR03803 family)